MRFSRLRLTGFKSFVETGEFVIEKGLTGVVGPNGCGKSNLVEALRWVMGENSYKNMRASGMDDVIFSGSATRPSRNTAEVTLFLDNTERGAPAAFNIDDELQVSRRIERQSGSVYRINGKETRARDVQLLFADQSTGARSPSMVGQGRIGELIQAKPQARRALLEEAAGISGLHTRRHEAELRLRAAEQNLARLDDVTGELQVQIESLRRQARQAQRFRALSSDIRQAEATLLHLRWTEAKTRGADAQTALNAATMSVAERATAQIEAAKAQAIGQHALPGLREAEAAAAAALQRLTIARAQLEDEAKRVVERVGELGKRIAQLDADREREERLRSENASALARLDAEKAALVADDSGEPERIAELDEALREAADELLAGEAALAAAATKRAEAAAIVQETERSLGEARQRHAKVERQASDAARDLAEIDRLLGQLADPSGKRQLVEKARLAVAEADRAIQASEREVTDARTEETAARAPLADARAALTRVETEASTLARILGAGTNERFPAVLERIRVARGFETALGAALGEDLDAALEAEAPARWMLVEGGSDPALPPGIEPLSRHVEGPAELARRLSQIGVLEAEPTPAQRQALKPGQRLVTRAGALWRWDGFERAADAPTPAAQRLAQKNRLVELQADVRSAQDGLSAARSQSEIAEARLEAAVHAERVSRDALRDRQRLLGQAREELSRAERAQADLLARRDAVASQHKRSGEELAAAGEALQAATARRSGFENPQALQHAFDRQDQTVKAQRSRHADLRLASESVKRERETRARRLAAISAETEAWDTRGSNAEGQLSLLAARRQEAEAELVGLREAPAEIEAKQRALISEQAKADAGRKQAADLLQTAENRQRELDRGATAAIEALAAAREARARAEERLTAAEDQRAGIERRMQDKIGVAPHLVFGRTGLGEGARLPDPQDVETRLERLKSERERLGGVNLRAEEEQRELSERLETIVSEREDVADAIRTLRQAILELNREGRERLLAAFDQVNAQFQRLFAHLFGGGTATLELIENDDPLEAGLEIMARPPGKRPQTMTLLSGGEQALTAMALIFAVFLTNPAPICVLDEVDAPLDDHNVERFCNLLDEMAASTETRFIVITHNPITMARMDRLFGVTMAEQGVSQLVSVDLQTAEEMREAG